jgi:hypothetical protein
MAIKKQTKKKKRKAAKWVLGDDEGSTAKKQRGMGTSTTKQTSGTDVVSVGENFEDDEQLMPSRYFSGLMPAWKVKWYEAKLGGEWAGGVNKVKEMTDG